MKKGINTVILFFCAACSLAQGNAAFIAHLSINGLKTEQERYLTLLPASDSTFYFRAEFYLATANDSLFLENYLKSKVLCNADTNLQKEANLRFLKSNNDKRAALWFGETETLKSNAGSQLAWKAALRPDIYTKESFPEELQSSFAKYKKAENKKPLLAAGLSMVLPGAGKLYAGKTKTFFLSFLLNAVYGVQTVESANKLGYKHPFTIVNAAIFSVFYLSNIYGSYTGVIQLKKERKKQFLHDAAHYYN